MKLLVLADLHYNDYNDFSLCKKQEIARMRDKVDAVVLCGDNAEVDEGFEHHHKLFSFLRKKFSCPIGFVAGNHDLWARKIGMDVEKILYEIYPKLAKEYDLCYLETGIIKMDNVSLIGTYGHYDYSFFVPNRGVTMKDIRAFRLQLPGLEPKIWKDKIKIKKTISDKKLCNKLLDGFEERLNSVNGDNTIISISHTLPCLEVNGHSENSYQNFYSTYSGSKRLGKIIENSKIQYHFCGHTHMPAETKLGDTKVINIGSDYKLLRSLIINTKNSKIKIKEKLLTGLLELETFELVS